MTSTRLFLIHAATGHANNSQAAALGAKLSFDTRLSGYGKVSCATCHREIAALRLITGRAICIRCRSASVN